MYKLCKTEQSAIRQRELELALAEMMNQQRYEEITVSEFCSHAGIPRKAFYRYFSSKDGALYALIDHTMLQYVGFRTPSALKDADNVIRELESFYQFWKDRQAFLDALKFSGLIGVMLERAINSIDQMVVLKKPRPGDTEFAQRHITRFAISGKRLRSGIIQRQLRSLAPTGSSLCVPQRMHVFLTACNSSKFSTPQNKSQYILSDF